MKIVIQRVQSASVAIEDSTVGTIKQGLLLLVELAQKTLKRILTMRFVRLSICAFFQMKMAR